MYRLHYSPTTASMAPHMLLREIGAPFELVLVDRDRNQQRSPEYLKLNPNGKIPTLVHNDLVLFESAAIVLHLCDQHPNAHMCPPLQSNERAHFYKWLMFLTNTLQANLMAWFYPERYTTAADGHEVVKAAASQRIADNLNVVDQALDTPGPYLLGSTFCAADFYLYMLVRWSRFQAKPGRNYPRLLAHADLVLARPSVQQALAAEGISEFY